MKKLIVIALAALALSGVRAGEKASCIWPESAVREMNRTFRFVGSFDWKKGEPIPVAKSTGSSIYRVEVNGKFAYYGPARGPKGYFREDEVSLAPFLKEGANEIVFTVAGYNVNSYYLMDLAPFLRAEVVAGGKTLWKTDERTLAYPVDERVQKVSRYSFQRPFGEAYRFGAAASDRAPEKLAVLPDVKLLPRRAPMPEFRVTPPMKPVFEGKAVFDATVKVPSNRAVANVSRDGKLRGFPEKELEKNLFYDFYRIRTVSSAPVASPRADYTLKAGDQVAFALDFLDTGFIRIDADAEAGSELCATFDEVLVNNRIDPRRSDCGNLVTWEFGRPFKATLETFEPYAFKYLLLTVTKGAVTVKAPRVREYVYPLDMFAPVAKTRYGGVEAAARRTFAENAVDCFTDCPGRERAGWLCDSFWTARVSKLVTGSNAMEDVMFENYALAEDFPGIPKGMLPMCYPADHDDGCFIYNWAMWFVLQLEEYAFERDGDRALVEKLRPRVLGLLDWLKTHENEDGLLEKVGGWNFVEWSKANDFTWDVNYPANMTYAAVVEAAARLYGIPGAAEKAAKIRETVRRQSFNGTFFRDHAVRVDGRLVVKDDITETCQYYAFFFRTATPESHPALWKTLLTEFGPDRRAKDLHKDVWPSNAFIGNYLRLDTLRREGLYDQLQREVGGYFDKMVELTGTLWEHDSTSASCCHGFASHALLFITRPESEVSVRELFEKAYERHLVATDAESLARYFEQHDETWQWQTEFWGKYMHSAAPLAKRYPNERLDRHIRESAKIVMDAQLPNGYIGNYRPELRAREWWDVWGMKYTLLGLLYYYDYSKDPRGLESAVRLGDYLISQVGPGGRRRIVTTGQYGGLASGSLLEPVVWLYRETKEPRFLAFAEEIVRSITRDADGPQLIAKALAGVPVAERSEWLPIKHNGTKAYEMMSCYQGLLDYWEVTGKTDASIPEAAIKTAEDIWAHEINAIGGACSDEHWYNGRDKDTRAYRNQNETCVTTTWLRLLQKLYAVTGDAKWLVMFEKTFYNVYLAALSPDGRSFASYPPINGKREFQRKQLKNCKTNCCNANGMRGFVAADELGLLDRPFPLGDWRDERKDGHIAWFRGKIAMCLPKGTLDEPVDLHKVDFEAIKDKFIPFGLAGGRDVTTWFEYRRAPGDDYSRPHPTRKVVLIGDSITENAIRHDWGFWHVLKRATRDCEFIPLGFSGFQISSWSAMERKSLTEDVWTWYRNPGWNLREVFTNEIDTIVVSLGMNDILQPSLRDTSEEIAKWTDDYRAFLSNLRDRCRPRHFVLATISPLTADPASAKNVVREKLNDRIRALASEFGARVAEYGNVLADGIDDMMRYDADYRLIPDFVHPQALGNKLIAKTLLVALGVDPFFEKGIVYDGEKTDDLNVRVKAVDGDVATGAVTWKFELSRKGETLDPKTAKLTLPEGKWQRLADDGLLVVVRGTADRFANRVTFAADRKTATLDLPAPWRVKDESGEWKLHLATEDYTGGMTPWSIDPFREYFGTRKNTLTAARSVWSDSDREVTVVLSHQTFSATLDLTLRLNGADVFRDNLDRNGKNRVETRVTLKKGWNELEVVCVNQDWQRQFSCEIVSDALDSMKVR